MVAVAARAEVLDPGVDAGDDLHQEYGLALKRRLYGLSQQATDRFIQAAQSAWRDWHR